MNVSLLRAQKMVRVADRHADSVYQFMENFCGPHKLEFHHKSEVSFSYVGNAARLSNVSFGYLEYGAAVTVGIGADIGHYALSLPVNGRQIVSQGGADTYSDSRQAILLSPGKPLTVDIDRGWRSVFITVNARIMELALSQLIGSQVKRPLVFETIMPMACGASASWWRMAEHYLKEVLTEGSMFSHPNVGKEFELSLVRALLINQQSNYSDEILRRLPDTMPAYLQKAVRFINENYQEEIRLETLRQMASVSADRLCAGFREFSGATPMGYLKKVRMLKAREQFLTSEREKSVSTVAFEVGFNHLGRFSVEYRNEFGESPTETISRRASKKLGVKQAE